MANNACNYDEILEKRVFFQYQPWWSLHDIMVFEKQKSDIDSFSYSKNDIKFVI